MKGLRLLITETLEEMQDSNLSSEAARQRIADRIISKRTEDVTKVLSGLSDSFDNIEQILRKNASQLIS